MVYVHLAYDKSNTAFCIARAKYFVPRGYAVVSVDCRGRYDSGGNPYFFWHTDWRKGGFEGQDVQDCLNWLGVQRWSSGKIGIIFSDFTRSKQAVICLAPSHLRAC